MLSGLRKSKTVASLALAALFVAVVIAYPFASAWLYQRHLAAVAQATKAWPHYGIAAGGSLPDMSPGQRETYMSGLEALGAGWVRFDFDWSKIQPDSQDSYDWSTYDNIVQSATAHHLKVIGIIDFTPAWARSSPCTDQKQCQPQDPKDYARFAAALSERYQSQGLHYWEIWNEPNTTAFFKPAPSVKAYSSLLKAASQSLHQHDPLAIVLSGSTAPADTSSGNISPADFLSGLYSSGARGAFDAVGAHPYTFPLPPTYPSKDAWSNLSQGSDSLRAIMVGNGDAAKKIWITEYGAPTGGPGPAADVSDLNLGAHPWHVTEALQAQSLSQALTLYRSYDWVGPFLIYSYQDAGSTSDTSENFFGLVRAEGTHKPAYDVARTAFTKP